MQGRVRDDERVLGWERNPTRDKHAALGAKVWADEPGGREYWVGGWVGIPDLIGKVTSVVVVVVYR